MHDFCHLVLGGQGCVSWLWMARWGLVSAWLGLASRHHEADRSWWRGHGTSAPQLAPTSLTAAMTIRLGLAVLALSFIVSRGRCWVVSPPFQFIFIVGNNIQYWYILVLSRFLVFYSLIHGCHFNISVY